MILEHIDKNNLHHAYLIEGLKEEILPEILEFLKDLNIATLANPDFCHIEIDNFKIDDASYLKTISSQKSFSSTKKIFIISANYFSLSAQNAMLKLFEEPVPNTYFFMIIPDSKALLKTLVSRFYVINLKNNKKEEIIFAEEFINMSFQKRINFIKEFLEKPEDEIKEDSIRAKALKFLNTLESILHKNMSKMPFDIKDKFDYFEQIFKVRKFLRESGSSVKNLLESVALSIPEKI